MSDSVLVDDLFQEELKDTINHLSGIASGRLYAWIRFSLGEEADQFADYVKGSWLSGSPVPVITGETRHSVAPWLQRKKDGKRINPTLFVRPGIIGLDGTKPIPGTLNYLGKWTGTNHEFMRPAFRIFATGDRITHSIERNVSKQMDKAMREKQ